MGVVNTTPDSFSDGGSFLEPAAAIAHARKLIDDGADIIDIGGESTRPGSASVSEDEELKRILPVLRELRGVPVSVDTRKPAVMKAALDAGASMINDIEALQARGALEAVARSDCAVCLMHKKGDPATMQRDPHYADVVSEVKKYLLERVEKARAAGIAQDRIVIDPGFGFGKTLEHNLALLKHLPELTKESTPVLVGWSRKSSLGKITGRGPEERLPASLAMVLLSLLGGATIVRVHDVRETRDVMRVWEAYRR